MQTAFSHSSPFPAQQQQQSQDMQSQARLQQQQRTPYFNVDNYEMFFQNLARQQHAAPQGTLSPQALHSPANLMSMFQPTLYSRQAQSQVQSQPGPSQLQPQLQPQSQLQAQLPTPQPSEQQQQQVPQQQQQPQGPTPEQREERKRQFQNAIRPLLLPNAFTGAQAVNQLTNHIVDYGIAEVDAATRLEILARIRDGAGNHYYRAWSENASAIEITREWIKAAAKGNSAALTETTMPLLHVSL